MRLLLRSATNRRPRESMASAWGMSRSPGPEPFWPQALMNLPLLSNFTMRALVLPPWPSATKMSPFGATSTADGALNSSGPLPATPALPSRISSLPSGLNLMTCWPLPSLPRPSVTQTLPSWSTCRPWGNRNMPAPNAFTSWPEASNLRIGSSFEPSQANGTPGFKFDGGANAPQRSATQTLAPSRSTSTPAVEPQVRPAGILPQSVIERHGLGSELIGSRDAEGTEPGGGGGH